jgi:IS30 family transposase
MLKLPKKREKTVRSMASPKKLDKEKIYRLRKQGLSIGRIAKLLDCSTSAIKYHIYPRVREYTKNYQKTEKRRKQKRDYYKRRYYIDPEFRRKMLRANSGG